MSSLLKFIDLGRMPYDTAYGVQCDHLEEVIASRDTAGERGAGRVLLVEHDPVITLGRRQGSERNLLASPEMLAHHGVELRESDRGGDITYHGPGQLVVYPILDLNRLNLGLHDYMRMLEDAVIGVCADFGVKGERDPSATGVWVRAGGNTAKVCAMGVRVRRWVSMHGLALNLSTNLEHFKLLVPCGLSGRPVTSLRELLGQSCPTMDEAKASVRSHVERVVNEAAQRADVRRAGGGTAA